MVYSQLAPRLPPPPAKLPPAAQPVLGASLAASDPACRALSPEVCAVLQAEGPVTWLTYVGRGAHAWSLEAVGLAKAVWRHPTPFTAAEVARMRMHPRFTEWVEVAEEPLWPIEPHA